MDKDAAVILTQTKNTAIGVILTLAFGGLGVFYGSIIGGVVMSIIEVICVVITALTLGFGIILLIPAHIISLVWVVVSINRHNQQLINKMK